MNIVNLTYLDEVTKYIADTTVIKTKLYPKVEKALNNSSTVNKYKKILNNFISNRVTDLYDTLPCSRLLCSEKEMDLLFEALNIDKKDVTEIISETYYGPVANFNPLAAKHEFTIVQLMVIRYFFLKNMKKELDLSLIYFSFSGKFYPSIHFRSYPTTLPVKHVMEYVINNCLSKKFNIVAYGSILESIKAIAETWLNSYKDKLKKCDDEDCVYLIQQLHSRIGSFTKNIAEEYYKVYENKDLYMNYTSDNYNADDYHISDNDVLKVQRIVERTMTRISSNGADYRTCKQCSDENITTNEFQNIITAILSDRELIIEIKELLGLMVSTYFNANSNNRDVTDISFLTYSIASKPNAKQKEILRQKEIIESWLSEKSPAYLKRRSRLATKNSYERAIRMYFALTIHNANRFKGLTGTDDIKVDNSLKKIK